MDSSSTSASKRPSQELLYQNQSSTLHAITRNHTHKPKCIWLRLHMMKSKGQRILILSPDTDTYHIFLPLVSTGTEVIIQLSGPEARELNLLHLHKLADLFKRDPDMVNIPPNEIAGTIQTLFVCTGCDYASFFFQALVTLGF